MAVFGELPLHVGDLRGWNRYSRFLRAVLLWISTLCFAVFVFMWLRRGQIVSRYAVNPDEAELMASAKRGALSWIPYKDYSTPTFGPVWPTILGFLNRLGLPMTIPMAHLLSAITAAMTCSIIAIFLFKRLGLLTTLLIVAPITIQWGLGFYSADFVGMATEIFSVFFLIASVAVGWSRLRTTPAVLLSSVLMSLAFWSKYQFGLIVLTLLIALWIRHRINHPLRAVFLVAAGFLCFPIVLFTASAILGTPFWKLFESIEFTIDYALAGGLNNSGTGTPLDRMASVGGVFFSMISITAVLGYVLIISLRSQAVKPEIVRTRLVFQPYFRQITRYLCGSFPIFIAGIITLYVSYPLYPHYAYILLSASVICLMIVSADQVTTCMNQNTVNPHIWNKRILFRLSLGFALLFSLTNAQAIVVRPWSADKVTWEEARTSEGAMWKRATNQYGVDLETVCPRKSQVLVWGWASELFSYYDWLPASRYPNTAHLMSNNPFGLDTTKFRSRFIKDLKESEIDCVINAIGPGFFAAFPPESDIQVQMPEIVDGTYGLFTKLIFYWDGGHIFDVYQRVE
jgi:hypothetical protein